MQFIVSLSIVTKCYAQIKIRASDVGCERCGYILMHYHVRSNKNGFILSNAQQSCGTATALGKINLSETVRASKRQGTLIKCPALSNLMYFRIFLIFVYVLH